MANITENTTIKRLRNKYRLVVTNDDTFEEVVTFKLSRVSLYITISTTFVLLVGLTICMLVFTPLKYYIPGYGSKKTLTQLQLLKIKTDSLEQTIRYNEQYFASIQKAFAGDATMQKDTTGINVGEQPENNFKEEKTEARRKKNRKDDDEEKPRRRRRRN